MEADGHRAEGAAGAITVKVSATETHLPLRWQAVPAGAEFHDLVTKMRWSYSRRTVLEQCPRRYYYEYYGERASAASGDPNQPMLRLLKSLQNRHERAGTIAHLVISTYFRKARSGEVWAADRLCAWAQDIFRSDWTYSQTDPDGISQPTGRFPPVLLHEYYYRHPDASALCSEAEKRLVNGVYTFATSPRFAEFRLAGGMSDSLIEHRLTLQGLPCQVDGKLDLAFGSGGGGVVVDWKLGGSSNGGNDSLQLAVYALWASCHFACEPEAITVCKAHLATGDIAYFSVTERVLANARARIIQDAERMSTVDKIAPMERRTLLQAFWDRLEPNPLGGVAPGFYSGFWYPEPNCITRLIPVGLEFGQGQHLPPSSSSSVAAYRTHYRQRLEYLENAGCYSVPPTVGRTLYCAYPRPLVRRSAASLPATSPPRSANGRDDNSLPAWSNMTPSPRRSSNYDGLTSRVLWFLSSMRSQRPTMRLRSTC